MLYRKVDNDSAAALPTVLQGYESFQTRNATASLTDIGKVFLKHGMNEQYGIALLHRHFELLSTQRIVEYNGVATAWPVVTPLPKGAEIHPTNWTFQNGKPDAYEFEFVPQADSAARLPVSIPGDFVQELVGLLQVNCLTDVFGMVKLPHGASATKPTFEATIGQASITFPGDDMNKGVPATWYFEDDGSGVCARVCSQCRDFGSC